MAPDTRGWIYIRLETGGERVVYICIRFLGVRCRHAIKCYSLASLREFVGLELEDGLPLEASEG
jgi:hypothetical protein